jgi:hypothetical protein
LIFFSFSSWRTKLFCHHHNANAVPKMVEFICHEQVSRMFDWLFSWIFTYYAFAILALICNFNLHGLSPTLHQEYSTRPKLLWVLQLWLDLFLCWAYLIQLWPKKLFCQPDADVTSCFRYLAKDYSCFKKSRHCPAYAVNQS